MATAIAEGLFGLRAVEEFPLSRASKSTEVAVDASPVVANAACQCPCGTLIGRVFGRFGASRHLSNRQRRSWNSGALLAWHDRRGDAARNDVFGDLETGPSTTRPLPRTIHLTHSGSIPEHLVEPSLQTHVRTADLIHDRLGPVEVLPLTVDRPSLGWVRNDIAHIADLVRELDQFRLG